MAKIQSFSHCCKTIDKNILDTPNNHAINLVDLGALNGGEVNLCGDLGVVAHGTADDVEGNVAALGNGGPGVTGYVEGQRDGEAKESGELIEVAVDALRAVAVLDVLGAVLTLYQGKEVLRAGVGILVEQALDVGLDADAHLLPGLASGIDNEALLHIGLAQVGKVNG